MSASAAHEFWTSDNKYHDLAQRYEQNIETTSPETVTSDGMCTCLGLCANYCSWASTQVQYYEYHGPDVKHIRS